MKDSFELRRSNTDIMVGGCEDFLDIFSTFNRRRGGCEINIDRFPVFLDRCLEFGRSMGVRDVSDFENDFVLGKEHFYLSSLPLCRF